MKRLITAYSLVSFGYLIPISCAINNNSDTYKSKEISTQSATSPSQYKLYGRWIREIDSGYTWIEFDSSYQYYTWLDSDVTPQQPMAAYKIINDSSLELSYFKTTETIRYLIDTLGSFHLILSPIDSVDSKQLYWKFRDLVNLESTNIFRSIDSDCHDGETLKFETMSVHLTQIDSVSFEPYPVKQLIDTSTKGMTMLEMAIELGNLLKEESVFGSYFESNDSILILNLENDSTLIMQKQIERSQVGLNFEHFFKSPNQYLLRIQFPEKEEVYSWVLVDRTNGNRTWIRGRPYFSPSGNKFVTIGLEEQIGSLQGIEFFELVDGTYKPIWAINMYDWEPTNIKWMSENILELEKRLVTLDSNQESMGYIHLRIEKRL